MMKPLRRKCLYKRSDNFKVIPNQFLYGGKKLVPDDVVKAVRAEIHDGTSILYPYEIPLIYWYIKEERTNDIQE